jgi:hypothetical protein
MKKPRPQPHSASITRGRAAFSPLFDWGGARIVVPPVAKVKRLLPGRGAMAAAISMDLRAFVPSIASNVVETWISEQIERRVEREPWLRQLHLSRRQPSWFDATAHLVADIVFARIKYKLRNGATWQLPEETLALAEGDCEDRATLLASALVAAGISPYNVRVALGHVRLSQARGKRRRVAHAWVVYKSEEGSWTPLEPVPSRASARHAALELSYEPEYVFNGDHQWSVSSRLERAFRARYNALEPTFHGEVHKSIVEHAASLAKLPEALRTRISRTFTGLLGHVIDKPDLNVRAYDPRDHFDSGLIEQSWTTVAFRLKIFYAKPLGDAEGLINACFAAHGIADFYAHSSYAHFLSRELGTITPYDPATKKPALSYDYANDPAFSSAKLTYYTPWYQPEDFDRFTKWRGRAISGRYSFPNDSHDAIEAVTNAPTDAAIPRGAAQTFAGSLPHHNEIAVDEAGDHTNLLYPLAADYAKQFALRYHLALRHITGAFQAHPGLKA